MKRTIRILIFLLTSSVILNGQMRINDAGLYEALEQIPKERVYLHQNSTLIYVGERLYFSLYGLNAQTNELSDLSKVAYIEMLGKNREVVFKQRIRLNSGLGQSDFFLPTSIASGSYKLVAYTRWMKNQDQDLFYQSDVFVINPYQTNEAVIPLASQTMRDSIMPKNDEKKLVTAKRNEKLSSQLSNYLSFGDNRRMFGKREKVAMVLNAPGKSILNGNFSVSVRKIDEIKHPNRIHAENFLSEKRKTTRNGSDLKGQVFLPELRGELISGKLINTMTGDPVANKKVSLSIPGNDFIFDIAHTNENGLFFFNLDNGDHGDTGIFQVLEANKSDYEILIEEYPKVEHGRLTFKEFLLDESMKEIILERSVQNQIENSYIESKPDRVFANNSSIPFYRNPKETYYLDDYTRFNTIEETMVEIINHVWIQKDQGGSLFFQVRPNEGFPETGLRPLLLVDGVFVENHEDFLEYNAKRVKSIHLWRDKYIVGGHPFQGILVVETKTSDYNSTYYKDFFKNVELFNPTSSKVYYNQRYEVVNRAETDRIPDFRNQLLWLPKLEMIGQEKEVDFFTSDVSGIYEISLEGISSMGKPISDSMFFIVE